MYSQFLSRMESITPFISPPSRLSAAPPPYAPSSSLWTNDDHRILTDLGILDPSNGQDDPLEPELSESLGAASASVGEEAGSNALKGAVTEAATEAAEDLTADVAADSLSDAIDPVMAGITAGMFASDVTAGMNAMSIAQTNMTNATKPGIGAMQQANMINSRETANASSMHSFMTAGALIGGPLGALLGYAFSPSLSSGTTNMNTAYSAGSTMVNPELQSTVSSGIASQESDTNQSVMQT